MIRSFILLVVCILLVGSLAGQDYFELSEDYSAYSKSLDKFYDKHAPDLKKKLEDRPIVRFVTDFSMGYGGLVMSIENDGQSKNKLVAHSFSVNRSRFRFSLDSLKENSVLISDEFSGLIEKLFELTIQSISPEEEYADRFDGIVFHFLWKDSNGNMQISSVWSPERRSSVSKVVRVCNDLELIAKGKPKKIEKVSKRIRKLIIELSE